MSKTNLLITLVNESVNKCYQNDKSLIDRSMEQASVARIFHYIQDAINNDERFRQFKEYNLDCEYNKDKTKIKRTVRCPKGTRPDLVLHKRWNTNNAYSSDNILVIEFKPCKGRFKYFDIHTSKTKKTKTKPDDKEIDFVKLEDFTHIDCYNYFLGIFIKLNTQLAEYKYFQSGCEKSRAEL